MNSAQLQKLIAKLKAEASIHKAQTAALKLKTFRLKQNIDTLTQELLQAEERFVNLTTAAPRITPVRQMTHPELKLTGS